MRTHSDSLLDIPLLLYMLREADPILGRTKIQKTVFLVEYQLREHNRRASHFKFFRYHNGPYSQQLWNDYDSASKVGLVTGTTFRLTGRGSYLVDLVIPELLESKRNRDTFQVLDRALKWCRPRTGQKLKEYAYGLEINPDETPGIRARIRDIEIGTDLIVPPSGGLEASHELVGLIEEHLQMTDRQFEAARRRWEQNDREAFNRLYDAVNETQPTAEIH